MEYFEYSKDSTYAVGKDSLPAEFFNGEAVPIESRTRLGYGNSAEEYLKSGMVNVKEMMKIIGQCDIVVPQNARCLDFGCGGGRMLRHIPAVIPDGEYWGCDTESRAIAWAQNYLGEQFRLLTNLREPHLPFEDGYFDFIYAGSVFSHINDMSEFWMLELRRIAKTGSGVLYLTFHDDSSLEFIRKQETQGAARYYEQLFVKNSVAEPLFFKDYNRIVIGRDSYSSQVFFKTEWLKVLLKKFFTRVELIPKGYGWQTAAVLVK